MKKIIRTLVFLFTIIVTLNMVPKNTYATNISQINPNTTLYIGVYGYLNQNPLNSVTFNLSNLATGENSKVTSDNGLLSLINLTPGKYLLKQETFLDNYSRDSVNYFITVTTEGIRVNNEDTPKNPDGLNFIQIFNLETSDPNIKLVNVVDSQDGTPIKSATLEVSNGLTKEDKDYIEESSKTLEKINEDIKDTELKIQQIKENPETSTTTKEVDQIQDSNPIEVNTTKPTQSEQEGEGDVEKTNTTQTPVKPVVPETQDNNGPVENSGFNYKDNLVANGYLSDIVAINDPNAEIKLLENKLDTLNKTKAEIEKEIDTINNKLEKTTEVNVVNGVVALPKTTDTTEITPKGFSETQKRISLEPSATTLAIDTENKVTDITISRVWVNTPEDKKTDIHFVLKANNNTIEDYNVVLPKNLDSVAIKNVKIRENGEDISYELIEEPIPTNFKYDYSNIDNTNLFVVRNEYMGDSITDKENNSPVKETIINQDGTTNGLGQKFPAPLPSTAPSPSLPTLGQVTLPNSSNSSNSSNTRLPFTGSSTNGDTIGFGFLLITFTIFSYILISVRKKEVN